MLGLSWVCEDSRFRVEPVMVDGQATNASYVWFEGILKSRYRVTIEFDPETSDEG